jgi:hypothetical protein
MDIPTDMRTNIKLTFSRDIDDDIRTLSCGPKT